MERKHLQSFEEEEEEVEGEREGGGKVLPKVK
jgi:hypothetical protein